METNLEKKEHSKLLQNAEPGSLMERLQNAHEGKGEVLLCDISGSMGERMNRSEPTRKIDALRDTVHILQQESTPRIVVFHTYAEDVHSIPPHATGGTNLAGAFSFLNKDPRPERIVLISDGNPDNGPGAIEEAKRLKTNISAIYIGEIGSPGEKFLRDLCAMCGGQFTSDAHALERPKELAKKITALLGDGKKRLGEGVIQL